MSGGDPHGTSARVAEPPADVLVGGRDAPPPHLWPRQRGAAVALAGALIVTGAVVAQRTSTGPQVAPPALVLRQGAAVLPRVQVRPDGRLRAGLQLDVLNLSGRAVLLTSAELAPAGDWRVEVMDDADTAVRSARGRPLRTGWNATLVLHRLVDCTAGARAGPVPTSLLLHLEADGRDVEQRIDLGPDQRAYAGRLDDALQHPESVCPGAVDPGPWTPPFLRLWTPSTD